MREVFFDTWAWIALANRKDEHHREALEFYEGFQRGGGLPVTTDCVLAETFSALRAMVPLEGGVRFGRALLGNVKNEKVRLEFIDQNRFSRTWELYERYRDKPGVSFFDLSSVAVMKELEIKEIFTRDRDFERVGLGFILLPG